MKIYIAGPMTGHKNFNFESFYAMARVLRDAGHEPINPAENDVDKLFNGWKFSEDQYPDVLLEDLALIRGCDAIIMLEDWQRSKGACAEFQFANICKLKFAYESKLKKLCCEYAFNSAASLVDMAFGIEEGGK